MARQGSTCIEWVQELRVLGSIFDATGRAEGFLVAGYKGLHAETGSVGWSKTSSSCPPRLFKAPLSAPLSSQLHELTVLFWEPSPLPPLSCLV